MLLLSLIQNLTAQSWFSRQWHNTVSHYNYYYNANLLVSDVRDETILAYKDNYKDVLSLYPILEPNSLKGNATRMDEVLKKCSHIIDRHSKGKWVDDSYLLMGDAHLFKGDFYSAIEVYEYVAGTYKGTFPAAQAEINLITTYILQGKYDDAEALYTKLAVKKDFPAKLKTQLAIAGAAVNIKQGKYPVAIKLLEASIPNVKNKLQKIRYNFVLAQLYSLNKRNPDALLRYKKVIKLNPPYEFAFNAKLNMAKAINYKNRAEIKNAKTVLRDMLRDDKNIDYFDQIYFELGNLELADKNESAAIAEYTNCLRSKGTDAGIKSAAYLALADLYFKKQDYENAQVFYDSAARTVDQLNPNYKFIQEKNLILNELIKHLVNIREKDSLLRLSENKNLREKTIDRLIKEAKEQAEREKNEMELKKIRQDNSNMGTMAGSTNFPFYNMAARNKGLQDFQRIWGSFELIDFWGIASNRQKEVWGKIDDEQIKNDKGGTIKDELIKNAPEERKKYYQNIPFTITDKQAMLDEISESYFLGANVYYQSLKELDKARLMLEELNRKYPKSKFQINSWYLLAKIFQDQNNTEKSNQYIQMIKDLDSNSTFLNVLLNKSSTDSADNALAKVDKEIDVLYSKAFDAYKAGRFDEAMLFKKENDTKYPGNPLQVNFDYLEALIIGKTGDIKDFRSKLQAIVDNYPNTSIADQAHKTIELIKIKTGETKVETVSTKYTFNKESDHFYMLIIPKGVDINQLKIAFLNYNKSFHPDDGLRVTTSLLGDQYQILIVNSFKSLEFVKAYLKEMSANSKFFTDAKLTDYSMQYIISKENFSVLITDKVLKDYEIFFKTNYNN